MIDRLQRFPDQNAEHRFSDCVGETVADIAGNIWNVPMDAGFSEAAGYALIGSTPSTSGQDGLVGMQGAVAYGVLPVSFETFDSLTRSEIYENTYDNYSQLQKDIAKGFALNGVKPLSDLPSIINHLNTTQTGVQMTMQWYQSFNERMGPNGVLIPPDPGEAFELHSVAAYNFDGNLQVKPFLGPGYGLNGYCYLTPDVFGKTFMTAIGFDPNAIRWISLLGLAATRYPYLLSYIPSIISKKKL